MNVSYIPLLQIQRDLYGRPRGLERFRTYLRLLIDATGDELALPPLVAMNPMGKEHLPALLDELLALDAESLAAAAVAEAAANLAAVPGDWKLGLTLVDDLHGGWTNRYACEFHQRFAPASRQGWLSGLLWSSEPATADRVRAAAAAPLYRAAALHTNGPAHTLAERLRQEGAVHARAGWTGPTLDDDDLEYTRSVLQPYLDATDLRTTIECLFGDAAGRTLGFTPRGLSPWAGLALAVQDARGTVS